MKGCDTCFRKFLFRALWNRLSERSLEAHQFLPINLKILGLNSFALHSAHPVDNFRGADKNFFGIASAQSTGTAKWPGIDNRHLPLSRATSRRYRRSG